MSEALDRIAGTTTPAVAEPTKMTLAERLEQHVGGEIEFLYVNNDNTVKRHLVDVGTDHVVIHNPHKSLTAYVPFTDIRRFVIRH